jgi:hypothetical protein
MTPSREAIKEKLIIMAIAIRAEARLCSLMIGKLATEGLTE